MGFEEAIPPVPDRLTEVQGIKKVQQSWLNQGQNKYYMNESLRVPKMAFAQRLNKVYSEFYAKVALSLMFLYPVFLLSRRYFVSRSKIPITKQPDSFDRRRPDYDMRRLKHMKVIFPVLFIGSIAIGQCWTDMSPVYDTYYDYTNKTTKMI